VKDAVLNEAGRVRDRLEANIRNAVRIAETFGELKGAA